jgi:hypothetical protein
MVCCCIIFPARQRSRIKMMVLCNIVYMNNGTCLDEVYEVYLVGGYADDAAKAQKISHRFFRHLHELPIRWDSIILNDIKKYCRNHLLYIQ